MISRLRQVQSGVLVPRWVVVVPATLVLVGATVLSWEAGPESHPLAPQPRDCCGSMRPPSAPEVPGVSGMRRPSHLRTGPKQARVPDRHSQPVQEPFHSVPPPASAEAPLALAISAVPSGPELPPAQEPEEMEEFLTAMEMGEVEQ